MEKHGFSFLLWQIPRKKHSSCNQSTDVMGEKKIVAFGIGRSCLHCSYLPSFFLCFSDDRRASSTSKTIKNTDEQKWVFVPFVFADVFYFLFHSFFSLVVFVYAFVLL